MREPQRRIETIKTSPRMGGACLLEAILGLASVWAAGATAEPDSASLKPLWMVQSGHPFPLALTEGLGFSFRYDGKKVGPGRPEGWRVSGGDEGRRTWFRHPSGLAVQRSVRVFPEFEAVEYTLRFKNEGQLPLPMLEDVNALDLTFVGDLVKGVSVLTCGGGGADATFPPKDFALTRTPLGGAASQDQVRLRSRNGLPSRINLPFFYIQNREQTDGVYIGIGWSGDWQATIQAKHGTDTLDLRGGIQNMRLKLQPGEEISSPSILLGCFRGPLSSGVNHLRHLIRQDYSPSVAGQPLVAPVLYTTWFDIGAELDEKLLRTLVNQAAPLGVEIFLLDAGWYAGTPIAPYTDMRATWEAISGSLGNWELGEEQSRFPSGLRVLADYVRSKGMAFGLWFEPERAGPDSQLAKTHPDWLVFIPSRKWALVDFGRPEVQKYFCQVFDRYIRELDLRYIRWDSNIEFAASYWAARDLAERRGIMEIRHLEGVHHVEAWIREHHPNVILESCAGGGQRIDLATLRQRHTIWISDQTMDPHIVRFHLEGLNHFIGGQRQAVAFAPMRETYRSSDSTSPDLAWQSCFGGAFGLAGRLHEWPQAIKGQTQRHIAVFKKIRGLIAQDYYLLEPQTRTLESWSGWQFHDPQRDEGFMQAFRLRSLEPAHKFVLHALDPNSEYQFTDADTGELLKAAGARLISGGLEFQLPPMSSRVLTYRKSP